MASKKSSTKKSSGAVGAATVKGKPENTTDSETSGVQTLADTPQYLAAYSPKTWVNGETIYATDLNHAEEGIADAQSTADSASSAASAAQSTADAVEASALTGINVNGTAASVSNHVAEIDVSNGGVYYGTCTTEGANTYAVQCSGVSKLYEGLAIMVEFIPAGSNTPMLNVNSTGAKNIWINGATASSSNLFRWVGGTSILFVYDGSYWLPVHEAGTYSATCSTAAGTSNKEVAIKDFVLRKGATVSVQFSYANTATVTFLRFDDMTNYVIVGNTSWDAGDYVTFTFDGTYFTTEEAAIRAQNAADSAQAAAEKAQDTADAAQEKAEEVEKSSITGINVNGTAAAIENHIAEINISSELTYDKDTKTLIF